MTGEDGLRRLEAQIAKDLDQLRHPDHSWVRPRRTAGGEHVASLRSFAEQGF